MYDSYIWLSDVMTSHSSTAPLTTHQAGILNPMHNRADLATYTAPTGCLHHVAPLPSTGWVSGSTSSA